MYGLWIVYPINVEGGITLYDAGVRGCWEPLVDLQILNFLGMKPLREEDSKIRVGA